MAGIQITIDTSDVRKLAEALVKVSKRALPYAVRDSLNTAAFEARKEWAQQIDKAMILRNRWTEKSLRVEKATLTSFEHMQSRVGSVAAYMLTQEVGGTETSKGKHGVPIPTTAASGQTSGVGRIGPRSRPRTKEVQRKNWLTAIRLGPRLGNGRKQRNAVAIRLAAKSGGVAFLDLGRRKGLFRVTGTKKGRFRVRMIWDLSKPSVTTKPRPTLEPTIKVIEQKAPKYQEAALREQFKRLHLLGY
jgi:hypothetical protein